MILVLNFQNSNHIHTYIGCMASILFQELNRLETNDDSVARVIVTVDPDPQTTDIDYNRLDIVSNGKT